MAQSLACLHAHLVFSTRQRAPLIHDAIRRALHAYLATVLQDLKCPAILINSVADHVRILFDLGRTSAVSHVVEKIKTASSKWMKRQGPQYASSAWQGGYGVFAVSESMVETVRRYVARQEEHHRKTSFQEEYRAFLDRHRIAYDERYMWD